MSYLIEPEVIKNLKFNLEIEDIRNILPINPKRKPYYRNLKEIEYIVLHCTASNHWSAIDVAAYDIKPNHISKNGLPTITYHYFIEKDGTIQYCVNEEVKTAHVGKWNRASIGIAIQYSGNKKDTPEPIMIESACKLLAYLVDKYNLDYTAIKGHRELPETGWTDLNNNGIYDGPQELRKVCPGMLIDMNVIRSTVKVILENV